MDLSSVVNTSVFGGWVRASIGALLAAALAKWPGLSGYLNPDTQTALAVAASGIVVGIWSHVAKATAVTPSPPILKS